MTDPQEPTSTAPVLHADKLVDARRWGPWAVITGFGSSPPHEVSFAVLLVVAGEDGTEVSLGRVWVHRTRWAAEHFARAALAALPIVAEPITDAVKDVIKELRANFKAPPEPYSPERYRELNLAWQHASSRASDARVALIDAESALDASEEDVNELELLIESMDIQRKAARVPA